MLLVHIAGNWTIRSLASQQPRVTAADRAGLRLPEPTPARNTARGLSTLADLIPPLTPGLFVLFWSLSTMRTRLSFPWNNSYLCTTSSERRESRLRSSVRVSLECLEEKTLLSTGLVAAYNFDAGSGTVLTDVSGNGNNGTITNATWSTAGKYGGALSFNGKSSTVTINNSPSLDLTTGMTLEAWVNPTTVSSAWRDVIYKGNDNYWLEATSTNNKLPGAGGTFGGADVATYGTSALATKTWTFLTETYDGATLRLYVNGVQVSSMAQTGNILTSTNALQIGGDSIYGQYFNGLIDNVRIYNTALTQSQIQTDMNTPVTSSAPAASAVTGETPGSGATGVATSTGVTATFNEAVQASSITSSGFVLKSSSGSTVTAVVSYNSTTDTATLTPSALLANSTAYTATINNVLSSSGVAMTGPFNWSFTTGPAPVVTSETPISGATGVATSTALTATFNEAVQASTITSSNLVLKSSSGATVPATISYNSSTNTATLTPSALLANSTTYKATVSGVEDTAGDPMAAPYSWSFTTAAGLTPGVTSQTPASGATGVATNSSVTATFNEAVQASTITTTNFAFKGPSGSTVTATVSYNSTTYTATLTPSALLANSTTYTATINNVLSSSGATMTGPFSWSFTTGPAPAITSETPISGATGVATSTALTATFNEAVQAATITSSNLVLKSSSGATVPATVSYNSSTNTATLTPSALLANSTIYTATVSGVEDTAGDPMAAPFSWSFTSGPAPSNSTGDPTTLAPSLGPHLSPGPNVIWVSTQSALQSAFTSLQSDQTIVIEPGTYNLSSTLYMGLNSNITNVTVRGSTDNFNDVTLLGNGMDNSSYGNVPMGISIWNAQNVTIADLSIGDVYYDPIEVRGNSGASAVTIYHVHLFDAGEQFIKIDPPASGVGASNSTIEYSM